MATLEFDAAGSNADGTNPGTALVVSDGTTYGLTEHSWPAPPVSAQWASSIDTEGSLLASVKHENRQLSVTVEVMTAAGLRALEAKIGKIQRERGTLKWTLPNSEVVIFDLLTVDQFEPVFDVGYYVNSGAFCQVRMGFTAAPYGRGAAIQLSDRTETTAPALTFTETGIKGTWHGLGKLIIDNDGPATTQATMIWGLESRNLVASPPPLLVEAENTTYITPLGATAAAAGASGASGSGNNVLRNTAVTTSAGFMMYGRFASIGRFRVYARVYAPAANTDPITLHLRWGNAGATDLAINDSVTLDTAWEDSWRLVDLGEVTARPQLLNPAVGDWYMVPFAGSTATAQTIDFDYFLIVPIDEGSGVMTDTLSPVPSSSVATSGGIFLMHDRVRRYGAGLGGLVSGYDKPSKYEGDYLLVPPAGPEGRSVRFIVKLSGGELTEEADPGIVDMSARLTYTPRYLVVPEP